VQVVLMLQVTQRLESLCSGSTFTFVLPAVLCAVGLVDSPSYSSHCSMGWMSDGKVQVWRFVQVKQMPSFIG